MHYLNALLRYHFLFNIENKNNADDNIDDI